MKKALDMKLGEGKREEQSGTFNIYKIRISVWQNVFAYSETLIEAMAGVLFRILCTKISTLFCWLEIVDARRS